MSRDRQYEYFSGPIEKVLGELNELEGEWRTEGFFQTRSLMTNDPVIAVLVSQMRSS